MRYIHHALILGLLTAFVSSSSLAAQTAPTPTLDQILQKYIDGVGGRAALGKIRTITAKGTIAISPVGLDGTVEISQKSPNKAVTRVDLGQGGVQREGFDGTVGWASDPATGEIREKTGADLVEARRGAAFPRELQMKTIYPSMTVKGREKVGARDAFLIEAVPAGGKPIQLFFDAETGLLIRQSLTREAGGVVNTYYENYKPVDGVQRAYTIRQVNDQFTATITITSITQNVTLDDALFAKPKGA
ncbi:MAG TPA: hypothetical protein VFO19_22390 [Vicinamibacterales bacterium]|nr:hypothetical protein [Vicinamibacterales bacterium]